MQVFICFQACAVLAQLISHVTQPYCCMLWVVLVHLSVVLTDAGVGAWWCFKHMICSIGRVNQRCIGGVAPRPGASVLLAAAVLRGSGAALVALRRGLRCRRSPRRKPPTLLQAAHLWRCCAVSVLLWRFWCCAVACIVAVLLCSEGAAAVAVLQLWRCYSSGATTALAVLLQWSCCTVARGAGASAPWWGCSGGAAPWTALWRCCNAVMVLLLWSCYS